MWPAHSNYLPKSTAWKGRENNFTVEESDKHYFCHIFKVDINNNESCWWVSTFDVR